MFGSTQVLQRHGLSVARRARWRGWVERGVNIAVSEAADIVLGPSFAGEPASIITHRSGPTRLLDEQEEHRNDLCIQRFGWGRFGSAIQQGNMPRLQGPVGALPSCYQSKQIIAMKDL